MTGPEPVAGIHHVTAFAGEPVRSHGFYRDVLGLGFVKKTVNFDDPTTLHLYYGDDAGRPGTVMTTFPNPRMKAGSEGSGLIERAAFAIPHGTADAWTARLNEAGIVPDGGMAMAHPALVFDDPDGMGVALVEHDDPGAIASETRVGRVAGVAIRVASSSDAAVLGAVLTGVFGFEAMASGGPRSVYATPAREAIEVIVDESAKRARLGAGKVHHVAWRARDETQQILIRAALEAEGLRPTEVLDRVYFRSIYFMAPGGVVFEVATDGPGFGADEPRDELGTSLRLPPWLEARRGDLEQRLPAIEGGS